MVNNAGARVSLGRRAVGKEREVDILPQGKVILDCILPSQPHFTAFASPSAFCLEGFPYGKVEGGKSGA